MYNIQPLTIWVNGKNQTVTKFNTYSVEDNLQTGDTGIAKFCWLLGIPVLDENNNESGVNWIASGNVTMAGADYANWNGSNAYAIDYVATEIGVSLIGNQGMIADVPQLKTISHLKQ